MRWRVQVQSLMLVVLAPLLFEGINGSAQFLLQMLQN
jgi:hypothetical protein